jgi:uncharacterized membrane protein YeiH
VAFPRARRLGGWASGEAITVAVTKELVLALDLLGTFVFALSGAAAGVKRKLDFFGIMAVSFAAANSGGIARDLLIGAAPPAAISDWRYLAASVAAGVLTFFWHPAIHRLHHFVLVADAAGLALFAVSGAQKALALGLPPVMAALLGMLTGIGGGIMRDLLLNEVPSVLRSEIYALAAAAIVVGGQLLALPPTTMAIAGAVVCFGLRLLAILHHWHLPVAPSQLPRHPEHD